MNRQEARDYIRSQDPFFLDRARHRGYVCPFCDNGSGKDGDGIERDKKDPSGTHYKCFKCGRYMDVVDLIGGYYGIPEDNHAAKFEKAFEVYGIVPDVDRKPAAPATAHKNDKHVVERKESHNTEEEPEEDYTDFFRKAAAQNDFSYLKGRGISETTQKRFMIGFVPDWVSPQAIKNTKAKGGNPDNIPKSPRCIIPTSTSSYLARDTRNDLTDDQKRFSKQKQGRHHFFNIKAMGRSEVVFVAEGEIDAMSLEEVGASAIGLGSTANVNEFVEYIAGLHTVPVLVLCLDNDPGGITATMKLTTALDDMGIKYIDGTGQLLQEVKDPNDAILADRQRLMQGAASLQAEALKLTNEGNTREYRAADFLDYFRNIEQQPEGLEVKTGFRQLDEKLQGGLHEGLYIIGAISSLGKTTFTLQLADQIASAGQDVLFFSLEMSKTELMAKSISRYSYQYAGMDTDGKGHFIARDTAQVMNNRRYKYYSDKEREAINEAIKLYALPAENMYIYEGRYKGQRLTVQHIKEITLKHRETTGRTPIVFVDYLQIIGPADVRASDKQNTDTAVFELKELSRELKTAVFAISSFNRDNYTEPVNMASFKESGAVEYSSDILFGLQYAGMDYQAAETDKARTNRLRDLMKEVYSKKERKEPIPIELKCLKNRNGYQFTVCYEMQAAFNHFKEISPGTNAAFSLSGRTKKPI